jgi:60 kDa SS-A/Ro ribonucleoprotein
MTRMNLNTFARHKVFEDKALVRLVARRLSDADEIAKARCFPYQLMCAHKNIGSDVPSEIAEALHDAMEVAIDNVPEISGKVYVFPDVSGSMSSPATGYRQGSTTAVECRDVAALVAAAFLRRNKDAEVIPFSDRTYDVRLSPRDSVMTNAQKLAALPSGGTDCSLPLELLNERGARGDLLVYVSDNESWIRSNWRQTGVLTQWKAFKDRNPKAKMVCIDITPNDTAQAPDDRSVLNVGGFSDAVFSVAAQFAQYGADAEHWVNLIEDVSIDGDAKSRSKDEDE